MARGSRGQILRCGAGTSARGRSDGTDVRLAGFDHRFGLAAGHVDRSGRGVPYISIMLAFLLGLICYTVVIPGCPVSMPGRLLRRVLAPLLSL